MGFIIGAIFIAGLIIFFIARMISWFVRRKGKNKSLRDSQDWHLNIFLSKEDFASQLFFLLAVLFLGVALLAINRDFGSVVSWETIVLVTSVIGMVIAYGFRVIYTALVSLIGFAVWWGVKAAEWADAGDIRSSAIFTGLMLVVLIYYVAGRYYDQEEKYKRLSLVYFFLGLLPITGALFYLSTRFGIETLEYLSEGEPFYASWKLSLSLLIFTLLFVSALIYVARRKSVSLYEASALVLLGVLFIVIASLPEQDLISYGRRYHSYGGSFTSIGLAWAAVFNIIIFLELLGIIFLGYLRKEGWMINLGALFLFILIFIKYFDWFFDSLDKSAFFISAGVLLFIVGWFMERGRRYMISALKHSDTASN